MNIENRRSLSIRPLPPRLNAYETSIAVLSIAPCRKGDINLEIKMEEWVLNWN